MALNIIYLFVLIVLPLIAQLRSWPPYSLFAMTAAVYAIIGVISFVQITVFLRLAEQSGMTIDAYTDMSTGVFAGTYAPGYFVVFAVFAAIKYAQTRYGAMVFPNTTKVFFWVLHIAFLAFVTAHTIIADALLPFLVSDFEQHTQYLEYYKRINDVSIWAGYVAIFSCLLLVALAIWSTIHAWRSGRNIENQGSNPK